MSFDAAIQVTPLSSHQYSVQLHPDWCIGTVPHGGYTAAVLHRLATTHFAHTHPTLYPAGQGAPAPIAMQLAFLRRTAAGPAVLDVVDAKLGARTSTIHVTLAQAESTAAGGSSGSSGSTAQVKVAGYITLSPAGAETGLSAPTAWALSPPSGVSGIDFAALRRDGRAGGWVRLADPPFSAFRRAARQVEMYVPESGGGGGGVTDQWARLCPRGDPNGARWTDAAVAFLVDMFPMALDGFDQLARKTDKTDKTDNNRHAPSFWYPTVTLNIDFKKRLPPDGVEWLFSRAHTKVVRNGRTDIDVVVLDQQGEVVALSTQVGLVVSASRNVSGRL